MLMAQGLTSTPLAPGRHQRRSAVTAAISWITSSDENSNPVRDVGTFGLRRRRAGYSRLMDTELVGSVWESKRNGNRVRVLATIPDRILGGWQCHVSNVDTGHSFRIHNHGLLQRYRRVRHSR
jgi:hypothetical protein